MSAITPLPHQAITPQDVRASVARARRGLAAAAGEIVWQIEMEAWRTLGYSSWGAMREAEVKWAAADLIRAEVESGALSVPLDLAISSSLDKADDHDGGMADKVISRILKGEAALSFDDDPSLDLVVVLGAGQRKPLRNIGPDDLKIMDSLRYRNLRNASISYDQWRETYEHAITALSGHATFGAASEAGAFSLEGAA